MTKDTIERIEDLKAFAENKFLVLQPCDKIKGKFNVSLEIDGYIDLHFLIIDIMKVSVAALDASDEGVTDVKNPHHAVRRILQFALQMVPLEEMQLVDKIHNIILDNSRKGDTKF